MKKLHILVVAVLMMAGLTSTMMSQTDATVTGTTAGAQLIVPMTLTQTAPMHFGTVNLLTGVAGTVVLPSNSTTRSVTGGVVTSSVTPLATNAAYNVTGTLNETYALTLPATITVTEAATATSMSIGTLTARFNGAGSDAVVSTLSASGTDSFTVGGTLTIVTSQAGGVYTGTFNVTVDYN